MYKEKISQVVALIVDLCRVSGERLCRVMREIRANPVMNAALKLTMSRSASTPELKAIRRSNAIRQWAEKREEMLAAMRRPKERTAASNATG